MKFVLLALLVAIAGVLSNPAKEPEAMESLPDSTHQGMRAFYGENLEVTERPQSKEMNSTSKHAKILECSFKGVKSLLTCEFNEAKNWKDLISVMRLVRCVLNTIMDTVHCFMPSLISQITLDDRTDEDLIKVLMETYKKLKDDRIFNYFSHMWLYEDESVVRFFDDMYEILEKIAQKYRDDINGTKIFDSEDILWNGDDLISLKKLIRCGLNTIIDIVHCIMTTTPSLISQIKLDEQTNEDLMKILTETYNKIKDDKMMNALLHMYFGLNDDIIESFILDMYDALEEIAKKYNGYAKISNYDYRFWKKFYASLHEKHGNHTTTVQL